MDENLRNTMLSELKTIKESIIEEWDGGMIVYCPGRKDNWKVAIVIGDRYDSPLMVDINYTVSRIRDKMGNDNNFERFLKDIHDIDGDPRSIKVKSQIDVIVKNYATKIDFTDFYHYGHKDLTFSRFCIIYYSILHSDRQDPYHIYHTGNFCNNCGGTYGTFCNTGCNFRKRPSYVFRY